MSVNLVQTNFSWSNYATLVNNQVVKVIFSINNPGLGPAVIRIVDTSGYGLTSQGDLFFEGSTVNIILSISSYTSNANIDLTKCVEINGNILDTTKIRCECRVISKNGLNYIDLSKGIYNGFKYNSFTWTDSIRNTTYFPPTLMLGVQQNSFRNDMSIINYALQFKG